MFVHAPVGLCGVDFSSMDEDKVSEDVSKVSQRLLEHGVTAYCPTIVTSTPDYYKRTLPKIKPTLGGRHGAAVLGKWMFVWYVTFWRKHTGSICWNVCVPWVICFLANLTIQLAITKFSNNKRDITCINYVAKIITC